MSTAPTVTTLTQQALAAIARRDVETAIARLQQAADGDPDAAIPRYLLGAEYAQIGLVDKAIDAMEQALARDPALATARLQLGLLHLGAGRVEAALRSWAPLAGPEGHDAASLFARGLSALALDRFDDCRDHLEAGIAINQNEPLNDDMRKILAALQAAEVQEADSADHVLLDAYRRA
jgi:tetratricopeptide (TPR) repeat protein